MKVFLAMLFLSLSNHLHSSTKAPERLFQMTGAQVNMTNGDLLYKSQAAGYYTGGGGVVIRSPIKNSQLMGAHLPKFNSGCGGIDIQTGGFSFISGDQLVQTLSAVSSNAAGFAFMLGLESVSPTSSNIVRQLESWATLVNGIGINSCETAASLVGSVWPASEMASEHICRTANTASNPLYNDYIAGRHNCSNTEKNSQNQMGNEKSTLLKEEYNIAWDALMTQPFFKSKENNSAAEMYMTLVGTFVVKKDISPQFYFSKAEDNEFLIRLLEGGRITKYRCKDQQCLEIIEVEEDIGSSDSWFIKIRSNLSNMQIKIINDEPLNESEKQLLQTSRLPLFKIINVLSAYHRGRSCAMELDYLSDIISWDLLAQILNEAIETVRRGCIQLRETSAFSTKIDRYMDDLEHLRKIVRKYEEHAKKGIDLEMRLIQKMQLLEKQVNSEIMIN